MGWTYFFIRYFEDKTLKNVVNRAFIFQILRLLIDKLEDEILRFFF